MKHRQCERGVEVEFPSFHVADKPDAAIALEAHGLGRVGQCREIRIDACNPLPVEQRLAFRAIVKPYHTDVNICPRENPFPIALGEKDAARPLDSVEHFAIQPAPDSLRREQSGPSALAVFDLLAGFLKPIATKVTEIRDAFAVNGEQFLDVFIAQFRAQFLCS